MQAKFGAYFIIAAELQGLMCRLLACGLSPAPQRLRLGLLVLTCSVASDNFNEAVFMLSVFRLTPCVA